MFKIEKKGAFANNTIKIARILLDDVDFNPPYQRYANIWHEVKRQLLLDSILNGYDLPKFYLHYITEFNSEINTTGKTYAIIDGKQRFQVILDFMNNDLKLSNDFVYEKDPSINISGLTYDELGSQFPEIKYDFDSFELDIVFVITNELERIEELFYRLNEGKPLNNAEKRNRIVGYLNKTIKEIISSNEFFTDKFKYNNKRLQYEDLCLKLIFTEYHDKLISFSTNNLDAFVIENRNEKRDLKSAIDRFINNLNRLNEIFISDDPLLKSRSIIPVYYYLITRFNSSTETTRPFLERFNEIRKINRQQRESNPILNEFDIQNQQGTHREKSLVLREGILEKYYLKYVEGGIDWDTKIPIDDLKIKIEID